MNLDTLIDVFNKRIISIFLILFFILFYVIKIFYTATVGVDAGYFLSITRDLIQANKFPYSDITTSYTPLGYFLYSIIYILFRDPKIETFYLFNLLINAISTFIIFKTLIIFKVRYVNLFSLIFFIVISPLIFDIKLEIFIVLFNSLLIFYMIKYQKNDIKFKHLFGVALFLFLIFFSKQYGLISIFYVFIIMYYFNIRFKVYFIILTLFIIISLLGISIFVYFGADWNSILFQVIGKSKLNCVQKYGDYSLLNLFIGLKYYKGFPLIFLSLIYLFKNKDHGKSMFGFIFIIIGLLPFYFQVFPHYLFFGFSFIFIFSVLNIGNGKIFKWGILYIVILNFYSVFVFFKTLKSAIKYKENWNEVYEQVDNLIPNRNSTIVMGSQDLYFGSKLSSLNYKVYGYNFYAMNILTCNWRILDKGYYFLINQEPLDIFNCQLINTGNCYLLGKFYNPRSKKINYIYKFVKV